MQGFGFLIESLNNLNHEYDVPKHSISNPNVDFLEGRVFWNVISVIKFFRDSI